MQLTFNPSLLCVLAFISHISSCLVQLATSLTQQHTEIQFCKLQDPARLYPINCIYFFFSFLLFFLSTLQNVTLYTTLLGLTRQGFRTCHDTSVVLLSSTEIKQWQICMYSTAAKGQCFMESLPFLLHVIEHFQCAKLQTEQKGFDSRNLISAFICWVKGTE